MAIHHCRPEASCQISTTTISRYPSCFLKRKIRWHAFLMPRTHTVFISRSQSWSAHRGALPLRKMVPFLRRTHPAAAGNTNSRVPSAGAMWAAAAEGCFSGRPAPAPSDRWELKTNLGSFWLAPVMVWVWRRNQLHPPLFHTCTCQECLLRNILRLSSVSSWVWQKPHLPTCAATCGCQEP